MSGIKQILYKWFNISHKKPLSIIWNGIILCWLIIIFILIIRYDYTKHLVRSYLISIVYNSTASSNVFFDMPHLNIMQSLTIPYRRKPLWGNKKEAEAWFKNNMPSKKPYTNIPGWINPELTKDFSLFIHYIPFPYFVQPGNSLLTNLIWIGDSSSKAPLFSLWYRNNKRNLHFSGSKKGLNFPIEPIKYYQHTAIILRFNKKSSEVTINIPGEKYILKLDNITPPNLILIGLGLRPYTTFSGHIGPVFYWPIQLQDNEIENLFSPIEKNISSGIFEKIIWNDNLFIIYLRILFILSVYSPFLFWHGAPLKGRRSAYSFYFGLLILFNILTPTS